MNINKEMALAWEFQFLIYILRLILNSVIGVPGAINSLNREELQGE